MPHRERYQRVGRAPSHIGLEAVSLEEGDKGGPPGYEQGAHPILRDQGIGIERWHARHEERTTRICGAMVASARRFSC